MNVNCFLTSSGILFGGRAGIIYITKANRRILAENIEWNDIKMY